MKNYLPAYLNGVSHPKIILIMPKGMTRNTKGGIIIKNLDGSIKDNEMTDIGYEEQFKFLDELDSNKELADCSKKDVWVCYFIKPQNKR